jgi:hypothetical protein
MLYNETKLKEKFMAYLLKFALQTLVWLVAIIFADKAWQKLASRLSIPKVWKLKKV